MSARLEPGVQDPEELQEPQELQDLEVRVVHLSEEPEEPQQQPEDLLDLHVRVVRLTELGARAAATALDEFSTEALVAPQPISRHAPPTRAHPALQPQARPAPAARAHSAPTLQRAAPATRPARNAPPAPARPPAPPQARTPPPARPPAPPQARTPPPARPPAAPPQPRTAPPAQARPAPQPQPHIAPQPEARPAPPPQAIAPPARRREPAVPPPAVATPTAAAVVATTAATARPDAKPARRPLITTARLFFVLVTAILYYGWSTQTDRYINPYRGLGYVLGIVGGSLMLVLLAYSLRKRWAWLEFLGSTPSWFKFHMVLGVAGPVCILFHSNFSTGATNSNVALFSMLTVAGSGLIGRYIYSHVHNGLYGRKLELGELRAGAETLQSLSGRISFVPDLVTHLESAEQRVMQAGPRLSVLGFAKPLLVAVTTARARSQLHRYIRRALHASSRRSSVVRAEEKRLRECARTYVDRRLAATRRVAEFEGYERLFSLWHSLHIPLIFVMVIAAIIHVIAVHIY